MSTENGETFVKIMIHYTWITATVLLSILGIMSCVSRRSGHGSSWPGADKWGFFASAEWPIYLRGPWGMLVVLLGVIPLSMMLVCLIMGPILASIEGWSVILGIEYMVTNVLGLQDPLTDIIPDSTFGNIVDIIMSLWAMVLFTAAMGLAASMSMVSHTTQRMPSTTCGLLRYMLIHVPTLLILVSLATGAIMSAIEDWSVFDGFLYMAGVMCGLANPLVDNVPDSPWACFVEVLCVSVELSLGGAIIGIISAHPLAQRVVILVEGADHHSEETAAAGDGKEVEELRAKVARLEAELEEVSGKAPAAKTER
eukprot:CAMPEP_0179067190 /NCGR_PEP_ID=MMETSP0796-20121207/29363_1 /TAXON_ID=73915 /ORGANISM="Pyrodinium bahamense, Strain pbaha01" /LENGTH=310 /DNA_ID=CAMNT_0020764215 /DNA_START=32 /DNA_END=964 /DNA_ORIENTATION=+